MVVYNLICDREHQFEGWFPSAEGYEKQAADEQISCPSCGSTNVVKVPHACAIHTKKVPPSKQNGRPKVPAHPMTEGDAKEALLRVQQYVRENFEDVGSRFAEEARRQFFGETEKKGIYGTATPEERGELDSDGVPYTILPKPELDS